MYFYYYTIIAYVRSNVDDNYFLLFLNCTLICKNTGGVHPPVFWISSDTLPGRTLFCVDQFNALGLQLIADTVSLSKIPLLFCLSSLSD